MSARVPLTPRGTGNQTDTARQARPARDDSDGDEALTLIEQVVRRENLVAAHARVVHNDGAPGVDGMTVDELLPYCRRHWARIREQLRSGTYVPQPVRRVDIPKPDGKGKRTLGIPTVLDRFIQQAVLQVLAPSWTRRSRTRASAFARDAAPTRRSGVPVVILRQAPDGWLDLDLERFFDRVNHAC